MHERRSDPHERSPWSMESAPCLAGRAIRAQQRLVVDGAVHRVGCGPVPLRFESEAIRPFGKLGADARAGFRPCWLGHCGRCPSTRARGLAGAPATSGRCCATNAVGDMGCFRRLCFGGGHCSVVAKRNAAAVARGDMVRMGCRLLARASNQRPDLAVAAVLDRLGGLVRSCDIGCIGGCRGVAGGQLPLSACVDARRAGRGCCAPGPVASPQGGLGGHATTLAASGRRPSAVVHIPSHARRALGSSPVRLPARLLAGVPVSSLATEPFACGRSCERDPLPDVCLGCALDLGLL